MSREHSGWPSPQAFVAPDLAVDDAFYGTMLPGDRAAVTATFGPGANTIRISEILLDQSDLILFMTPKGFVTYLPLMMAACLERPDEAFDLFSKLEFLFEPERMGRADGLTHFSEVVVMVSA